jgi:hypothetical protein
MRIMELMTAVAFAGAGFMTVDPAMAQVRHQADANGNIHAVATRPAAHGTTAPSRASGVLSQHRAGTSHRFARRPVRSRRGFSSGYYGYPAYVADGDVSSDEPYESGYPADTEAPPVRVSAPVYAPPTLYPAKYYYSPSPGVYFYRPAFEHHRKCNCG